MQINRCPNKLKTKQAYIHHAREKALQWDVIFDITFRLAEEMTRHKPLYRVSGVKSLKRHPNKAQICGKKISKTDWHGRKQFPTMTATK